MATLVVDLVVALMVTLMVALVVNSMMGTAHEFDIVHCIISTLKNRNPVVVV